MGMETLFKRAATITQTLADAGYTAYWAGGCVRDGLLGRVPKDIDIATTATPDEILKLFPSARPVGRHFGVVLITVEEHDYDVATFRTEGPYHNGRHPESVTFCGPEEDARRRDFTINGLFRNPFTDEVIDFVGGRADLKKHIVRAIGDPGKRFAEDHLRMLRAVRFAATLDFEIEENTLCAIRTHASKIKNISMERIQQEFSRILLESKLPGDAIVLLKDVGLLEEILPELMPMIGQEQPPQFHPEGDVFTHTVIMLNDMRPPSLELALAALLHDVGKPPTAQMGVDKEGNPRIRFNRHARVGGEMTEEILRRLKYPRAVIKAVTHCVNDHMRFKDVREMRKSKVRRLISAPTFPVELELHRLDCASSHGMLDNYHFLREKMEEQSNEPVLPPCLLSGNDIMELGIPEGPKVGRWIKMAHDHQLEQETSPTHTELREWVREKIRDENGDASPFQETSVSGST